MKIELVFIPSPGINNVRATAAMVKLLVNSDDRLSVTLVLIPERFSPGGTSSVYPESESRLRYYHLHAGDQSTHDQDQTYMSYIESQKPHVRNAVSKLAHEVSTHPESPRRLACMVVEFFCTPMIDVADEFGLPAYTYFTSNASYLGLMFHVQHLHDQEHFDVTKLRDSDAELDVPSLTRPHLLTICDVKQRLISQSFASSKDFTGNKGYFGKLGCGDRTSGIEVLLRLEW